MILPDFKSSKRFLGDTELACLVASVKNSQLHGIATRHIAEFKEDPKCKIYLRGADPKKITPWQQQMLEELLEKDGLAAAVREGMQEYASSSKWGGKNYAELAEEDRKKIKEHGIAPHITISTIVIDEVKRQVILRADTIVDGNLDEHGISIYLKKDRWRFDTAEYFDHYAATLLGTEEQRRENAKKLLDKMYPVSAGMPLETDLGPIIGDWILDIPESTKLLKKLWLPGKAPKKTETLSITAERIRNSVLEPIFGSLNVVRCERRGGKVVVYVERPNPHVREGFEGFEQGYWCTGEILVSNLGKIYRRSKT